MTFLLKHGVPTLSKFLVGALAIVSFLVFLIKLQAKRADPDVVFADLLVPMLQLIPRTTILHPWVLFTAIFAETHVILLLLSGTYLFLSLKYVERFWGPRETIVFVVVIGLITNLWTVIVTIITNIARGDSLSMDKPLGGGISYYFAFLVVFKQLIPEHNLVLFHGLLNFRIKHLPFVFLCIVSIWSIFVTRLLYPAVPSFASFFSSYLYLRFFQIVVLDPLLPVTTANGSSSEGMLVTGDASEAFRLAEFFPSRIQPLLTPLFDRIYKIGIFLNVVPSFDELAVAQSNLRAVKRQEQVLQTQKNVANSVAERRRQVALQMIEQRINREPAA